MKITKWDGKPVSKPGVYDGVPLDVYHSQEICDGPSVSSSGLRRVLEINGGSPAHFWDEWSGNPNRAEPEEEKAHFVFGRAVHHLLLGEMGFNAAYCVRPKEVPDRVTGIMRPWSSNLLECRAWTDDSLAPLGGIRLREDFLQWFEKHRPNGRAVLTQDDINNIVGIAQAIGHHPDVNFEYQPGKKYSLLNGLIEQSFFWQDKATGLWLKARPDAIPTSDGDYADLKTTSSVSYFSIQRSMTDFAYNQQAALIAEGSQACANIPVNSYTLVFAEKKRPWCVRPVPVQAEDISIGHAQNRNAIDLIARCIHNKHWPGPGEGHIVSIPLRESYRKAALDAIEQTKQGKAA